MMKKLHHAASALALAGAALLPLAAAAQNIAIVNGKPVPKARADMLLEQVNKQAAAQGQQLPPDLDQRVRDKVVLDEIFVQEAQRRGVAASREYQQQMELARTNILVQALFADFQKKSPVTDAEAKTEYDQRKAQAGTKEYHARHILVETEDEAKSVISQLKGGAKFEDLAKKLSKDPGSGQNGGDLDWAAPGNYVPEFSEAMTKLAKGAITETPVKSQFGWHVIRLDDTREASFPSFDDVKEQIKQMLGQQKLAKFRDDLRSKAKTDYKFGG